MRLLSLLWHLLVWAAAVTGIAGIVLAGLSSVGMARTFVVTSGSMSPTITAGDVLISWAKPAEAVEVGDVVTVHSEKTRGLVTHRVVEVEHEGDRTVVRLKGDANDSLDPESYVLGDSVLEPVLQIDGAGPVVSRLRSPGVVVPLVVSGVALLALSSLARRSREQTGTSPCHDEDEVAR